ncbi:MAG TPA: septum formation initiator family protein [Acidobacteriota bacterium]|jgi:cell division protein FtsB|nr:septum formation initiator family protein [Acidobacteriota bacterium]
MSAGERLRRESFLIVLLLIVTFFLYLNIFGQGGYLRLREYRMQLESLRVDNERVSTENERLMKNIKQLKENPHAMEKLAREDFNFARPGDIIVTLPEK